MMKGREGKALAQAAPSMDLLVCFPSRMPKAICSPARPSEPSKRHHHHHHQRKKSFSRGQASPLVWAKSKAMGSEVAEPTSPKVTCAGQIKVRPKSGTWQSVMEEIEKIHTDNKKQRKRRLSWAESTLGFKKEIMQFLTCLRSIRLDLRCFGSFHDEEDEQAEDEDASRTVFSKWFMLLQENHGAAASVVREEDQSVSVSVSVPPPNALLLMRCRSAPAKSWVREEESYQERQKEEKKGQSLKSLMEEEENNNSNMVLMRYDSDFYDVSSDVAKETWIVGGIRDLMSRTRSCKT